MASQMASQMNDANDIANESSCKGDVTRIINNIQLFEFLFNFLKIFPFDYNKDSISPHQLNFTYVCDPKSIEKICKDLFKKIQSPCKMKKNDIHKAICDMINDIDLFILQITIQPCFLMILIYCCIIHNVNCITIKIDLRSHI